jgi:uroporphyrinogen-III decarboxylase
MVIVGELMGLWPQSYHVYNLRDFLIGTNTDSDKVRGFLDKLKDATLVYGRPQIQAGPESISWADQAIANLVGPENCRACSCPITRN